MLEVVTVVNNNTKIIAITGSAGKTTVKTLIATILREKWEIFESSHYNNTFQMTEKHMKRINKDHEAAVLEYGMAFAGALTKHCSYIQPNISVITNVGLAHIGNFDGDIRLLAAAKSEIIKGMDQTGMLFLSSDNTNTSLLDTADFKGEIITAGFINNADYRAKNIEILSDGVSFKVTLDGKDYSFFTPLFGVHNVYNVLFAIAVCHRLGFTPKLMIDALKKVKKPEHRLNVLELADGIKVIDDTVHSNPVALKAAIDVLDELGSSQKIVVLGSMSELGEQQAEYHKDIGKYLAEKNVDFIFTHGNISVDICEGAVEAGFSEKKVSHKTRLRRPELLEELTAMIKPGATILVKGFSRLKMFEIVEYLVNYYQADSR